MSAPAALEDALDGWTLDLGGGLTGACATSVEELGRDAVERTTRGAPVWATYEWLRAIETTPSFRPLHAILRDDAGRVVAFAPAQVVVPAATLPFYDPARLVGDDELFGDAPSLTPSERARFDEVRGVLDATRPGLYPALVAAAQGSYGGFCVDERAVGRDVAAAALVRVLDDAARRLGCPARALLYLSDGDARRAHDVASARGYERVTLGADAVLDVLGTDVADYERALPHKQRGNVRRERRDYAAAGLRTDVRTGPDALGDDLVGLQVELRSKYGLSTDASGVAATNAALRAHAAERVLVLRARCGADTVGFVLYLMHERALYSRVAGFDYARTEASFCYFNLVYYEALRWAMRHGFERIHLGLGSYDAKVRRGCRLAPLHGYVAFDGPGARVALECARLQSVSERRRLRALGAAVSEDGS